MKKYKSIKTEKEYFACEICGKEIIEGWGDSKKSFTNKHYDEWDFHNSCLTELILKHISPSSNT